MEIEKLRTQLQELQNLTLENNGAALLTTRWSHLEMHLVCYETRYSKLRNALTFTQDKAGLSNTKATRKHLTFILLNVISMLSGNEVKSRAYPGSPETIRKWAREDNPEKLTETLITVVDALCECGYLKKVSGATYMRANIGTGPKMNRFIPTENFLDEVLLPFDLLTLPLTWKDNGNYVKVIQTHEYTPTFSRKQILPLLSFKGADEKKVIKSSNDFLKAYNRALGKLKITVAEGEISEDAPKSVYRIFCRGLESANGRRLKCGGRLYGGFWQQFPNKKKGIKTGERPHRGNILINGETTVELDYSAFHINMLYARLGKEPFAGDAYAIGVWPRILVKACILTALNCKNDNPKAAMKYVREHKDAELREHYNLLLKGGYARLIADFTTVHPLLAQFLHSDVGIGLQRQDSEIAMRVIHTMAIMVKAPVLSIHDSFIAPARVKDELSMCMLGAFESIMGTRKGPPIKES